MSALPSTVPKRHGSSIRTQCREDYLETALAHVSDAVIVIDVADEIRYMNAAAERLTGAEFEKVFGQPLDGVFAIVHADTAEALRGAIDTAKATDDSPRTANRGVLVGETGNPVVIEYTVAAHRDAHATLCGAVIVFRDITHHRAAELALQTTEDTLLANAHALFEEKERSQVTLNSIGDAVISTDFRGRVSYLNTIAEQMTGWAQAEATGRPLDEIFFIVDASTREHIPCPTMLAIIENRRVKIESTCVLIRRDGSEVPVEDAASPIHDKNGGVVGAVMVAHDVTVARDLSAKLAHLALHDSLTDLPNRTCFANRLDLAVARSQRRGDCGAVLFVDLDRFKPVNDTFGHPVGDQLLRAVAQRLVSCVRTSDVVSRFGGDEFVILLTDLNPGESREVAEKVKQALDAPYVLGNHTLHVTASIGIAYFPDTATDAQTLLKYADLAMYTAKQGGRNNCELFNKDMLSSESQYDI
jgi:diguanylate cyclase (GGDEF)-like protein/PAS domain S-box-containing protein